MFSLLSINLRPWLLACWLLGPTAPAKVVPRCDFAHNFPIWRAETHTGTADIRLQHAYTVSAEDGPEPAAETEALPMAAWQHRPTAACSIPEWKAPADRC